ncbi:MAG: hypothetical protein GEV12_22030 [Micromonosporaceae bacterium]|nr:hypothetical protein [Micromonosporaceae bacterium]
MLVVCHGTLIRVMLCSLLDLPLGGPLCCRGTRGR